MSEKIKEDKTGRATKQKESWRNLPPEKRPAIGEKVNVIRGKFKGYHGTVAGIIPKGVQVEVSQGALQGTITVPRHILTDEDGKPMPEVVSEEEARRREEHQKLVKERAAQAERIYHAVTSKGYEFWDYCRDRQLLHSYEVSQLLDGEMEIGENFLADLEKELDIGVNWFLYGDERCKEHPCGEKMKKYLDAHPEKREIIWNWMVEDGAMKQGELDEEDETDAYDGEDEIEEIDELDV